MSIQVIRGIYVYCSPYNLRITHTLSQSNPRKTTYGPHSFSYFSAQQWNDLPDELRKCTFNDFKRRVQSLNTFD